MITVLKLSQLNLAFVKDYLKIDYNDDDSELTIYIQAALSFIKEQVKADFDYLDTKPDLIIPALLLISHFYENKSIYVPKNSSINITVEEILSQYREWL